ncbi:hypothetical protein LBW89_15850 [Paenibacillus sp. alder61]|uniref:Uncharacterized protein n=1 Tax=Paenibacillus faecis TaxID=862114 RepID=A0A5D0CM70_9BACL|nr:MULTISPECIES: hypothetical protein [Paenibacillus]MCA1294497.1 hypothetical protein [Paenibacillus sp. alder61]TYA10284.1 hypothetical protein FRY98_27270 [Paenibacillus faecis]
MLNALLLLVGLLSPFAGFSASSAMGPPPAEPVAELALLQAPLSSLARGTMTAERLEHFDSMGGVSLSDDVQLILSKKGEPERIEEDDFTGFTELHYGNLAIGLYEDLVYYVHTGPSPKNITLNGKVIPLQKPWLERYLGKPDFVAEDGDVYIRGHAALKLYKDADTGKITGADLFDDTVS